MKRKNQYVLIGVVLLGMAVLITPTTSMFTGFSDNPALSAANIGKHALFDSNPATRARTAVPKRLREHPHINQRSVVTANTDSNSSTDVHQNTQTGINDQINYETGRSFDNIYVTQDALSRIRQSCRSGRTCTQNASSDINQGANIRIGGRFSNVFLIQHADSRINQDCWARDACLQDANSNINQNSNITSKDWSSNGFVNHRYQQSWTPTSMPVR